MIRKYIPEDIEQIINVWYEASTIAHPFLETKFVEKVKSDMENIYIPNSETWVYEINDNIAGFISMIGNEIGGLFVLPEKHNKGIGTALVDFVRVDYPNLTVEVFKKNHIGIAFYNKYGFKVFDDYVHKDSGNVVLKMKINN